MSLKNIVNVSRISRIERTPEEKSNVLLSLFTVIGMATVLMQITVDSINGLYDVVLYETIMLVVFFAAYILNELKYHLAAKITFLTFLNTAVFVLANLVPKDIGVYFYFFPTIGITSLVFEKDYSLLRNSYIALPILLIITLELSNYQLFGSINIQEGVDDPYSFFINIVASMAVLVVSIYQMMLISREIETKRLKIADELQEKNVDLLKSNTELDHFVYSTSHDLKAPLSSINGLINIAKYDVKEPVALEYFEKIENRIDRLNSFIKDIIDLSRNSRLNISTEEIDLKKLIDTVIENNQYMENASSIVFNVAINAEKRVVVDRARLEVILNNLISNSIKYHQSKGKRSIDIQMNISHDSLYLKVQDNGIGIAADHIDRIFEMFYRGHEDYEGSGLGLYIVHDVVNKLGGTIQLNSAEGKGTTVEVIIPITITNVM